MMSKHFLGLCLVAGGCVAASYTMIGCSGVSTTGSGGAGGTGASATASSSSKTTSSSKSVSAITSSSGMAAANPTCEKAIALALDGKDVPGTLPMPDTDFRWYTFMGKKGDPLLVFTTAKTGPDPFDTSYLDTVVTLFGGDCTTQVQIAQNDDPHPRFTNDGTIFTILPADAQYWIRIAECNGIFAQGCANSAMISTFDFTVGAGVLDVMALSNAQEGMEPNDTDVTATDITMKYQPGMNPGTYYLTNIFGMFQTAPDVDVYQITIPMDINVDPATERSVGNFYPLPSTPDQDGSTVAVGKVSIVDPTDPMKAVASIALGKGDDVSRDLSPPLKFGTKYFLFVERDVGMAGTNDFYFLRHYGGGSNPIEKADATNDDIAMPEVLNEAVNQPGAFFIDGDISKANDIDHYSLTFPAGTTKVTAVCGGQRIGSGIRGMTLEFLKGSAGNGTLGQKTEDAATDALLQNVAIPAGETKVLLKMTANAMQDPNVTSTFYRCGIYFQ